MRGGRGSRRVWWCRAIAAVVGVALVGASVVLAASSTHSARHRGKPRTTSLRYACARDQHGVRRVLQASSSPAACSRGGGLPVDFVADRPVSVCRSESGAGAGLVQLVDDATCKGSHVTARSLPRKRATPFCASRDARVLRWVRRLSQCSSSEVRLRLGKRGRGPTARTRAVNDDVSTSEDAAITLDPLANDAAGLVFRPLRFKSIGTGLRGDLIAAAGGRLRYDPRGRFESLKHGEVAHERFGYRATDGVHTAAATVDIAVEGVNDAPVAFDDSASSPEDPPAPVNVDLVKADAPAGTPGKDTDVEGDPLTPHLVSTTTSRGASVTLRDDGTADYHPSGLFEQLGDGQTLDDTFSYTVTDPGGAASAPATATVTVHGANDNPQLANIEGSTLDVAAGPGPNHVSDAVTVSDVDTNPGLGGDQMAGAVVSITGGFDPAHHDTLGFAAQNGITGSYDSSTGVLTLTGTASRSDYEQALRSITFDTDIDAPASHSDTSPLDRTITFQVDDGAAEDNTSNTVTRTVHVTTVDVSATPSLTPGFAPGVSDYAIRCTDGVPINVSADAPAGTTVSIDGNTPQSGSSQQAVTLSGGQGFAIVVSRGNASATYHARCLPSDFPTYQATVAGQPQARWFFVTPRTSSYAAVFNADGVPVWWYRTESTPFDFKLLSNGNVGFFSHWNGSAVDFFNELKLDGTFVRSSQTVGTQTDFHEYQETKDASGNRLMLTYPVRQHVDVSAYTGKPEDTDAAVIDGQIQMLSPNGSLLWSWSTADHIAFAETGHWWQDGPKIKTADNRNEYDVVHVNSIEDDGDAIIVSMRHTDSIYRIDKATGAIDWKLGGTARPESLAIHGDNGNSDADFGGQHDARRLPDGTITLHDNGTDRNRAPRALQFAIDTSARTATLLQSVTDPDVTSSFCCGSARKLPGGDWVMSWGSTPIVTELTPDGERPFLLEFPGDFSYRANPVLPGVLSAQAVRDGMDAQYPRP